MVSVRWQITGRWCGRSRVSVSTLSGAAAWVYLSSACNYKWSQFDGSSHAPHRDISYSSHNAVIDVLEPVGRHRHDSTGPISSKSSDILTGSLSLRRQRQYLTPLSTNHLRYIACFLHPSTQLQFLIPTLHLAWEERIMDAPRLTPEFFYWEFYSNCKKFADGNLKNKG